jgi:hypothetical protein
MAAEDLFAMALAHMMASALAADTPTDPDSDEDELPGEIHIGRAARVVSTSKGSGGISIGDVGIVVGAFVEQDARHIFDFPFPSF